MRRSRFLAAVESEVNLIHPSIWSRPTELPQISHKPVVQSPGFANEKKVEHLAIINEVSIGAVVLHTNSDKVLTALY